MGKACAAHAQIIAQGHPDDFIEFMWVYLVSGELKPLFAISSRSDTVESCFVHLHMVKWARVTGHGRTRKLEG